MVKDVFREAESGGNPPVGWTIDRIYINNRSDYFLPVLLKDSNATKSMFYRVSKDWLLYSCPISAAATVEYPFSEHLEKVTQLGFSQT